MKVFLGGTTNNSRWRDKLIPLLKCEYFNPVVKDWNAAAQEEELRQRAICDYRLYVITPKYSGVYAIAEIVDDSNKRPGKTILTILREDGGDFFDHDQLKSFEMLASLVNKNGSAVLYDLQDTAEYINDIKEAMSAPTRFIFS